MKDDKLHYNSQDVGILKINKFWCVFLLTLNGSELHCVFQQDWKAEDSKKEQLIVLLMTKSNPWAKPSFKRDSKMEREVP